MAAATLDILCIWVLDVNFTNGTHSIVTAKVIPVVRVTAPHDRTRLLITEEIRLLWSPVGVVHRTQRFRESIRRLDSPDKRRSIAGFDTLSCCPYGHFARVSTTLIECRTVWNKHYHSQPITNNVPQASQVWLLTTTFKNSQFLYQTTSKVK